MGCEIYWKGAKTLKRIFIICIFSVLLNLCPIHSYALSWPPPNYDMPRTILHNDSFDYFSKSLRISYASITNVGLKILGITLSVGLISKIFLHK